MGFIVCVSFFTVVSRVVEYHWYWFWLLHSCCLDFPCAHFQSIANQMFYCVIDVPHLIREEVIVRMVCLDGAVPKDTVLLLSYRPLCRIHRWLTEFRNRGNVPRIARQPAFPKVDQTWTTQTDIREAYIDIWQPLEGAVLFLPPWSRAGLSSGSGLRAQMVQRTMIQWENELLAYQICKPNLALRKGPYGVLVPLLK